MEYYVREDVWIMWDGLKKWWWGLIGLVASIAGVALMINIITIQSYPFVGGLWTTEFTTVGRGDLAVSPFNGTSWEDLVFVELRCGDKVVERAGFEGYSVVVDDYVCFGTSSFVVSPVTVGVHSLRFEFGRDVGHSYNYASNPTTSIDFNDNSLGDYLTSDFNDDWDSPSYFYGQSRTSMVSESHNSTALRILYPEKKYGNSGKVQFYHSIPKKDEYYLSYWVKFSDNFDWKRGGKLPGLCGGTCNNGGDKPTGKDGWSARLMWRQNGSMEVYLYHPDQKIQYGDKVFFYVNATRGDWHHVVTRIKMNTPTNKDGIVQAWWDDKLVVDRQNIRFRDVDTFGVSKLVFDTFFGGNDITWAPEHDVYIYYDDFIISNTSIVNITSSEENETEPIEESKIGVSLYQPSEDKWVVKSTDYISEHWDFIDEGDGIICYEPKKKKNGQLTDFHKDLEKVLKKGDKNINMSEKYFSDVKYKNKNIDQDLKKLNKTPLTNNSLSVNQTTIDLYNGTGCFKVPDASTLPANTEMVVGFGSTIIQTYPANVINISVTDEFEIVWSRAYGTAFSHIYDKSDNYDNTNYILAASTGSKYSWMKPQGSTLQGKYGDTTSTLIVIENSSTRVCFETENKICGSAGEGSCLADDNGGDDVLTIRTWCVYPDGKMYLREGWNFFDGVNFDDNEASGYALGTRIISKLDEVAGGTDDAGHGNATDMWTRSDGASDVNYDFEGTSNYTTFVQLMDTNKDLAYILYDFDEFDMMQNCENFSNRYFNQDMNSDPGDGTFQCKAKSGDTHDQVWTGIHEWNALMLFQDIGSTFELAKNHTLDYQNPATMDFYNGTFGVFNVTTGSYDMDSGTGSGAAFKFTGDEITRINPAFKIRSWTSSGEIYVKHNGFNLTEGDNFTWDYLSDSSVIIQLIKNVQLGDTLNISSSPLEEGGVPVEDASPFNCSCPGSGQNHLVNLSLGCFLNDCDMSGGNMTFFESGIAYCNGTIDLYNLDFPPSGEVVYFFNNSNCRVNTGQT